MNYQKEASNLKNQANALNLLSVVLLAVVFYALTNDALRSIIATVAFGLFSTVVAHREDMARSIKIMEANAQTVAVREMTRKARMSIEEAKAEEELQAGDPVAVNDGKARKAR